MATIGLICGTGIGDLVVGEPWQPAETRYGPPSGELTLARVGDHDVLQLQRHGRGTRLLPGDIPYRANIAALLAGGAGAIVALHAVGSLDSRVRVGDLVVAEQLIDRTKHRPETMDERLSPHTAFADPFCESLRELLADAAVAAGARVHTGETMVVIEGPRFSTRAESRRHAADGATVINMTAYPEAILAREVGLCYASLAYVTDLDSGTLPGEGTDHEEVMQASAALAPLVAAAVRGALLDWDARPTCRCTAQTHAHDTQE